MKTTMKLSEKLQNYRSDRPDEWTMDEFIRDAKELEKQVNKEQKLPVDLVSKLFEFKDKEPNNGDHIGMVWEDGSDCECEYIGLDRTILPLPTKWYYVNAC